MEKSILVIDDDWLVTTTIARLLAKEGYSAKASENGYKALEEIFKEENEFDLIVCDLRLPGIDGVETVKKIKEYFKEKNKHDVPAIFITGYANSELDAKAQKMGKVIYKPFDTGNFLESVKEYIEK